MRDDLEHRVRSTATYRAGVLRIAAALALVPALSAAAGEQTGSVLMEEGTYMSSSTSAGFTFFYLQGGGAKLNRPTCNTVNDRWVINLDWPGGKYQLAILMTAMASGRTVRVLGTGDCGVWSDTETVMDIRLNNS